MDQDELIVHITLSWDDLNKIKPRADGWWRYPPMSMKRFVKKIGRYQSLWIESRCISFCAHLSIASLNSIKVSLISWFMSTESVHMTYRITPIEIKTPIETHWVRGN